MKMFQEWIKRISALKKIKEVTCEECENGEEKIVFRDIEGAIVEIPIGRGVHATTENHILWILIALTLTNALGKVVFPFLCGDNRIDDACEEALKLFKKP